MNSPPPAAAEVIQRVHRFAVAMRLAGIDVVATRAALLVTMEEAFALLDSLKSGPWALEVWSRGSGRQGTEVRFDLDVSPRPGMFWATLFGVALIVESDVVSSNDT